MSTIVTHIKKLEEKVWKSGCDYLYGYYDELMEFLNSVGKENLSKEEKASLRDWSHVILTNVHSITARW